MKKKYSHITFEQRVWIEKLYKKMRISDVAEVLGLSTATVYNELKRCPKGEYEAEKAEDDACNKSRNALNIRMDAISKSALKRSVNTQIKTFTEEDLTDLAIVREMLGK